ncbi:MAG: hypothetical protein K0Q73_6670, partial [Paenibacillus sp.]|nr:hypothetical protein [Paenibacillus sp.]
RWITPKEVSAFQFPDAYDRGPVLIASKVRASYYIRKDWLDRLGLSVPNGYAQLTEVVRAFTYRDPDQNGLRDTYGFAMPGGMALPQSFPYTFPQYMKNGILGVSYIDDDGYYRDGQSDPLLGQVVDDILAWSDAGLINPDWYNAKESDVGNAFALGKIGIFWTNHTQEWVLDSDPNSYYRQLKLAVPDAEVVPFNPYPNKPLMARTTPTVPWMIGKRTIEQYPEKARVISKIIDWLASEEGYLLTTYGQEGVHYSRKGQDIIITPDAYEREIGQKGNFLAVWKFLTPNETERLGLREVDPRLTERDRGILQTLDNYPVARGLGTLVLPPEGISIAEFRAVLLQYVLKMIFEDHSGANWPSYREKLMTDHKGLLIFKEYIRLMQAAGIDVKNEFQ